MNAIQIILITLLAALKKVDQKGPQIFIYNTVFWGFLAGAIMGDIMTGMAIGATFQLMSLGVAAIGGTSVPDYQIGAIISIAIAVSTGQGIEAGIAVGLPVCLLYSWMYLGISHMVSSCARLRHMRRKGNGIPSI